MTPHIQANKEEIASIVLMPGDPLRAQFIAENYLAEVQQVNGVRNMLMYTGIYQDTRITVAGSGMGVPSIGIYSYELFKFYDVETIIRVGSAGAYSQDLKLYDVILTTEAYSDSNTFAKLVTGEETHLGYATQSVNQTILESAKHLDIPLHAARVHSSDVFYAIRPLAETVATTGAQCVEMESYGLFTNAKATGKQAACLLSISDHLITGEETSAQERQTAFDEMIRIALESAVRL